MSSSALRIVAILLAIGAVVLGYTGYQAGQVAELEVIDTFATPESETARIPVIIAAKDIATNTFLAAEDITIAFVDKPVSDSFAEKQQVIGFKTRMPISPGDMLLPEHFHSVSSLTANIYPTERAVAVSVDEVTGTGGFIEPGDRVDVLLFLPSGHETGRSSSAQLLLPAIRVLAYGNQLDDLDQQRIKQKSRAYLSTDEKSLNAIFSATGSPEKTEKPTGKQSKTAVLAVNQHAVSTLLLAESMGRIRLALLGADTFSEERAASLPVGANYFVSMEALTTTQPIETVITPQAPAALVIKPTIQKAPRQVIVNRGLQETVVNIEQEK